MTLTAEQRRIVEAPVDGPHLVNAGAGTGKTYTVVERALDLVVRRDFDPRALLIITFTNAAAAEIVNRINAAFGGAIAGRPTCGTFHGVAAGLLQEFAYVTGTSPDITVIDDGRARALFRQAFGELLADRLGVDATSFPLLEQQSVLERDLADLALHLKHLGRTPDEFERLALAPAEDLERIDFGGVKEVGQRVAVKAGWPRPNPERTPAERHDEAERERRNIRVVAALLRRFDALLDAEALLTFGDVLHRATRMVDDHPAIRAALQARWRHAIVDEFQDTNPSQIAFLEAIFGPELRPVLAVGDLRQAIYAFNGADPLGLLRFRELPDCTLHPLTENRRSFQPILEVAHHALAGRGGVPPELHEPLTAHRGEGEPTQVRFELFDSVEDEAEAIAGMIAGLVGGGVSPRECAILLRTRTRANVYAAALTRAGIAVQLESGVGFFDAAEVREVSAWLKLVETPDDPLAVAGALQSATIALGDGVVSRLAEEGQLPQAALIDPLPDDFTPAERERMERFRAIAGAACALADAPLVDGLRTVIALSGAELARAGDAARFDQARANLAKLVRLAAALAQDRPLARVRDFLDELAIRDELELDLPPAELEGERVVISTIHGAKGREWPYVFVANCSPQTFPLRNMRNDAVVKYDDASGTFALKHGIDGRPTLRWYLESFPHDSQGRVTGRNANNEVEEEYRLLYVALTRARDAVYVSGRRIGRRESDCAKAVQGWFTENGYDVAAHAFAEPAAPIAAPVTLGAESADVLVAVGTRLMRESAAAQAQPVRRGTLSYSAMAMHESCPRRARYHYVLGLPDLPDDAPPMVAVDNGEAREPRDAMRFGRIVHKVLEYDAQARIDGAKRDLDRFVADAVEEEEGTPQEAEDARRAAESAQALLDRYELIDCERRFAIEISGVALGGYIDLLARDDAGRLVVVDYKTGRTPAEHYALQFALYARAVHADFTEGPQVVLLRIDGGSATAEIPTPSTDAELDAAVAASKTMASDEPHPGPECRRCPYAHDICREAAV